MNSISLKKSAVAFIALLAIGSVGFNSAYGYGGGGGGYRAQKVEICHNGNTISVSERAVRAHLSHGDTRGACPTLAEAPTPAPLVLGEATSRGQGNQKYSPILTSFSSILLAVQSSNEAGNISNEDATKLTTQLSQILAILMTVFR